MPGSACTGFRSRTIVSSIAPVALVIRGHTLGFFFVPNAKWQDQAGNTLKSTQDEGSIFPFALLRYRACLYRDHGDPSDGSMPCRVRCPR